MSSLCFPYGKDKSYGTGADSLMNRLLEIREENIKDEKVAKLVSEACEEAVGQHEFIQKSGYPETPMQKKIQADVKTDPKTNHGLGMLTSPFEGNFLKILAEMNRAEEILDIGMYVGYSAVTFAESAFAKSVVTLEVEEYYKEFVESRLAGTALEEKVRVMLGPVDDSLVQLSKEGKQFDFIFIDANKTGYLGYYKCIMDNYLLKPNGTIACDNALWYGTTHNKSNRLGEVLYEFVEYVKNDERVTQMIIPIRDGIFLIRPNSMKS